MVRLLKHLKMECDMENQKAVTASKPCDTVNIATANYVIVLLFIWCLWLEKILNLHLWKFI